MSRMKSRETTCKDTSLTNNVFGSYPLRLHEPHRADVKLFVTLTSNTEKWMKFPISCLLLVCPAFSYNAFLVPSMSLTPPLLTFSMGAGPLPPLPSSPKPRLATLADTHALIRGAAKKHGVSAAFVKSIVAAESNFNCDAISAKGAIGLMQLMPETAREYGADATIPEQNIDAGTHYLRVLMDKYRKYGNSLPRVIAAYNAGPGMVDRYHGVPPFRETRRYVVRVLHFLRHFEIEGRASDMPSSRRVSARRWESSRAYNLINLESRITDPR